MADPTGRHASRPYVSGGTVQPDGTEPSIGALVAEASRDLSTLLRAEIDLAKSEIRDEAKTAAKGGAMFGGAAFLGLLAVILLSIALAYGLVALGVWPWLAFVIVAVFYLLIAGVLALIGRRTMSRVRPPERTIRSVRETAKLAKRQS
jgi:Putative Actinobacterial Holin-X, holin superfamily III